MVTLQYTDNPSDLSTPCLNKSRSLLRVTSLVGKRELTSTTFEPRSSEIIVLLHPFSYAIKARNALELVLYGIRIGGFHALTGSDVGAVLSNIKISYFFCVCPPTTVSSCYSVAVPVDKYIPFPGPPE